MKNNQIRLGILICSLIANFIALSTSYSATFTLPKTISAADFSYDGQDITVDNTQLTIDGSHQFNSVQLINGAVLTHSSAPVAPLIITSTTFFSIDSNSSINIEAKGNVHPVTVTGASGGGYGGLGGAWLGTTNAVFGSATNPVDHGVGGRGDGGTTLGGGAIKIVADQLILDGGIYANGQGFVTFFTPQGGGSGGSVWLDVGTFSGTGVIEASGGSGFTLNGGGGGGGGRVAVYYDSATFDLQGSIVNEGGICQPLFGQPGQPGTIYLEETTVTPPVNLPPVANAGTPLVVNEQTVVILQGSATDSDGIVTGYSWAQTGGPTVTLINANTATPSFTAPTVLVANSPTVLSFQLTVTDDDTATDTADTSVDVLAVNASPTANAGTDINTNEMTLVTLSGSGTDSDGSINAYLWEQISGTAVTLNNPNTSLSTFVAPTLKTIETLSFRLTATDNETGTGSDEVLVTVNPVNTLPIATINAPASVAETTLVTLDGSASSDPDLDGLIVSYNWTQIGGPGVTLNNATSSIATFTAPSVYQDTTLNFRLNILDDEGGAAMTTTSMTVFSTNPDDDGDNMLDLWEIDFFGNLDQDGTADSDNDGATDLQEHDFGTDPTVEQQPGQPEIVSPDDVEVSALQPLLTLTNPGQLAGFSVSYQYEVYADAGMSNLVASTSGANLSWMVNTPLSDNTQYYWRARAAGTTLFSGWVNSTFFVNTVNDAPGAFNISAPQDGVWVSSFTPSLSVTNSVDIDNDALSYSFEVYLDGDLMQLPVASVQGILPGVSGTTSWTVDVPLLENNWYSWRAIVTDEHGLSTASSSTPMFFVNTVNDAPTTPTLYIPVDNSEITTLYADLTVNNATDPEGGPLTYMFEIDTVNTFDSANLLSSAPVAESPGQTGWSVNALLDNSEYFWRAKASDGAAESDWVNGSFFVNQFNDAPGVPVALNPGDSAWVGNLQPTLEVYPVVDIDGDSLSYQFEVYAADNNGGNPQLIMTGNSASTNWQLDMPLSESGYYYWRTRAIDEHGLAGEWNDMMVFFADDDGINDAPVIKLKHLKYEHGGVLAIHKCENKHGQHKKDDKSFVEIRWKDHDPDSNATISLYFDTDSYGEDGILISQGILEDPDDQSDRYKWDISQMADGIYFVYAVIDDGFSSSVEYSRNAVVIGNGGGLPFLLFNSPSVESEGKRNQRAKIEWRDLDYNSNASISFYYDTDREDFDGTLIVDGIDEDPDHKADKYLWDVSAMPEGEYFIYAIISDETSSYRVYAEESFTIHHHGNDHDDDDEHGNNGHDDDDDDEDDDDDDDDKHGNKGHHNDDKHDNKGHNKH